jgi:hypothetical protein
MENDVALKIYEKIRDLTLSKKLKWASMSEDQNDIRVFKTFVDVYELRLTNNLIITEFAIIQKDRLLGKISENFLASESTHGLFGFFETVKRQALGIDEGLDDLLSKLGQFK